MARTLITILAVSLAAIHVKALSNSLAQSSIRLTEPKTGCEVVLIGCFHGSQTSAADVREALELAPREPPLTTEQPASDNAVVLELCASRCADLIKMKSATSTAKTPWVIRYTKNIQKTAKEQGLSSAAATALLTGVSGLQSSKLEPGLEFKTALDIAKENGMDVILADQSVDITVEKLGKLPQTTLEVLVGNEWLLHAKSLARAVIGLKPHHLTLPLFLLRSKESIREAFTFFLQPLFILLTLQLTLSAFQIPEVGAATETLSNGNFNEIMNVILIGGLYMAVALPATKIVLSERDDCLTKGIRTAACDRKRVVAVLGLLHVNGVSDRLQLAGFQPSCDIGNSKSQGCDD